ncbi:MAG: peptidoglycan DD-metalloendopeptidase family protein [Acidobacteria bacterium]|nr:peptidoglycan DD-metalloendopeptidase family protein [Acidobacteriota bacterium]
MGNPCSEWIPGIALLALLGPGAPAGAAEPSLPQLPGRPDRLAVEQDRLQRVSAEIRRLRGRLDSFRARQGSLLDQLERMALEIALLEKEVEALGERVDRNGESLRQTRAGVESARARVDTEERALAAWLRDLYTRGPVPYLALLIGARDAEQLLHAYRYASFLTESEAERLRRYREARAGLEAAESRLLAEETALRRLLAEREARASDLAGVQDRRRRDLDRIRGEADLTESVVRDLSRTQADLRDLIGQIRDGGPARAPNLGLGRFRGVLDWPASGPISVPFGERLHPRFGTVTPHPGVTLAVGRGEEIRAVYDGRVVFSDWFRGYGNMVILDHGRGFLSIYAHASRLLVGTGDEILQGDVIARTGDTGSLEGPQLYFEIRENGAPIDPVAWFRRR